jgi:glutaconate CoA-transferase, subunit B
VTETDRYSADEMMTVTASRQLADGAICFVGIGLPSEAANLARLTHAPNLVLIYESGTIGTRPLTLPLSIGDDELATTSLSVVSVPEIFSYWLQAGRVDIGFLSAAEIDRFANLNSTVIGSYERPEVRLPGAGGAPEIAAAAGRVMVMLRHKRRMFVEAVDFITTVGFGRDGGGRPAKWGAGPTIVITDLGILRPDPVTHELSLVAVHPGIEIDDVRRETSWDLKVDAAIETTDPPTSAELEVLRDLKQRTEEAHRR